MPPLSGRLHARNCYRIPALLDHIARSKKKKQPERAEGFKAEFDRRYKQMCDAGLKSEIDKLIAAKKAELKKAA